MFRKLVLGAAFVMASEAAAENAAALVGVSEYRNFDNVRGAAGVTAARDGLRRLDFDVFAVANGSRSQILDAIFAMANEFNSAERAILVMNGNFLSYGGSNWFLSAGARPPNVLNTGTQGIFLGNILDVMAELPGGAVVILGEPSQTRSYRGRLQLGLGAIDIPQGVTVIRGNSEQVTAFARNRLTNGTTDLIAAAREDGLTIEGFVPRQLPLVTRTLQSRPSPNIVVDTPDLDAWDAASTEDTVEAYRKYMADFPNGRYRSEARARMTVLQNDPQYQARQFEERLGLTRDQRRQVQRDLTQLSYDTRGVDGLFGNGTRNAIKSWQEDQGYVGTTYLTGNQIELLSRQARNQRAQQEQADRDYWSQTGATGGRNALLQYLDRYPNGLFAEEAAQKLNQLNQRNSGEAQARAEEQALNLSPVIIGLIEFQLRALGLNPGQMDGQLDDTARNALRQYQQSQGLPQTGYISREVIARLINR